MQHRRATRATATATATSCQPVKNYQPMTGNADAGRVKGRRKGPVEAHRLLAANYLNAKPKSLAKAEAYVKI